MYYKNLDELFASLQHGSTRKRFAIAAAEDEHSLDAAIQAQDAGTAHPVLIGDETVIRETLAQMGRDGADFEIINETGGIEACAQKSIDLANQGHVDFILKGMMDTSVILKAAFRRENRFLRGGLVSSTAFMELSGYHKLICLTDGAINMYPDLEQKKQILLNAVDTCRRIGIDCPKVAVLCAIEKCNLKMPETMDAAKLKEMNLNGEIKNCIVEGPISFDIAMNKEAARIKGFDSPVAGDADILLMPDIVSCNISAKALSFIGQVRSAVIVAGLKVPLIITSRSSPAQDKYLSIMLAASGDWRSE